MLDKLIRYDSWANQRVYNAIQELDSERSRQIKKLFIHLLSAQKVWYNRALGLNEKVEIWPEPDSEKIRGMLDQNPELLENLTHQKEKVIRYRNSKGIEFENTIEEILHHLIVHGQHHRAQIAMLMRQAGEEPPVTDFIFYLRSS